MAKGSTIFGQARQFSDQATAVSGGGSIPTVQFSSGRSRVLDNISKTMFGLSAQFEDQLDNQAEAEAQKEGALAGLAGDTEERSYETIRGRSYNKAMLETAVTSLETRAMLGAQTLQNKYYDNPVALENAMNDYFEGMAKEVEAFAPGSGASFRQRQTVRSISAVEQARDVRFKMTQDEATASLIEYENSVVGQVKKNAAGLFSDNPALSSASSAAVVQTVNEYMQLYNAVDPVTGKPLFSEVDKAKARVHIQDKVMSEATLAWFDAQSDPVSAYLKTQDPDFKFNVNVKGEKPANIVYGNQGKTRNLPIKNDLANKMSTAAGALGAGVQVKITSGGQVDAAGAARGEGRRIGTKAHDHGNAADVVLVVNGKEVLPSQNPELYHQFAENAAAAGIGGIGHYNGWVHLDIGAKRAWGPDESSDSLNPLYGQAIARGRSSGGLKLNQDESISQPLRSSMSEGAWSKVDAELRQRITFAHTMQERQRTAAEREIKDNQSANAFDASYRIFAAPGSIDSRTGKPVQPITFEELANGVISGDIDPSKGEALIKALSTEKPDQSDPHFYQELQRRMWNGEDVQDLVLQNSEKLSQQDADRILNKNNDLNISGEGRYSAEETRGRDNLKNLLAPQGILEKMDSQQQFRAFEALNEYDMRVQSRKETGERIPDIIRDIADRSRIDMFSMNHDKLQSLPLPRFGSMDDTRPGERRVDIEATKINLRNALSQKKLTEAMAIEEMRKLKEWERLQNLMDQDAANNPKNKKK